MSIEEVHDRIFLQINKEAQGYLSHEEVDIFLDRAQLAEFMDLFGNPKDYQPGRPVPRIAYGMTIKIHDDLGPFKEEQDYTSTSYSPSSEPFGNGPDGIMVLPSDYMHTISLFSNNVRGRSSGRYPIKVLNENELADRLTSEILEPSITHPNAVLGGTGGIVNGVDIGERYKIQLFPEEGQPVTLWYLRRPAKPVFSYTLSGRTVVFDEAGSTDLEWNDVATERIINRSLEMIGNYLTEPRGQQYHSLKNERGL